MEEDKKPFCEICKVEVWSLYTHKHCPNCNASPKDQEVRNYDMMWHDGDVYCTKCDTYIRGYDAG